MLDDLDAVLEEEEQAQPAASRHRNRSRGGRSAIAFFMSLVLLGLLVGGGWFAYSKVKGFFVADDYAGPGGAEAIVQIKTGQSATDIGTTLVRQKVVASVDAFTDAAKDNNRSKNIQAGWYRLKVEMKASDALAALLDPKSRWVNKVTIPEGLSYQQTFQKLSQATKIPVADFAKAAKNPVALGVDEAWFRRGDGKPADKTDIEGFLYPATYELSPRADATEVLKTIIGNFNAEMEKLEFVPTVEKGRGGISPYQALIVASIAQAEALKDEDMPKVSRVIYNRAYGEFPCHCLGLDSTVNYWLRISGKKVKPSEKLTQSDLHNPNNPYNTHDKPGLPPGPIGNPGQAALKGAMSPTNNFPYYYFISIDTKGTMAYGKTGADHDRNRLRACQNGIPLC
ncbi:endolytic transglycosylase MltG [Actinoplanes oblitus]|uniref:Endolytic murein transglycosylase n=1 Tax=Actinoplanes oblitus TaxID=3040509 RepID=A0ABY8WEB5_9ACTN|nr:endolytic transglycosylase MltG [Actinoplanes oblitus]WIM94709.1 endolytic transglycosylase MltG [Actinoplanes oblitus]